MRLHRDLDVMARALDDLAPLALNAAQDLRRAECSPTWVPTAYEERYLPGLRRVGLGTGEGGVLQGVADLHVHTEASDGGPLDEVLARAVELRLDAVAITDHDTVEGALEARRRVHLDRLPLAVVPGVEVSSADGHIGALFVTRNIPKGLPADETVRLIHEAGGLAVAHHPFVPRLLEMVARTKLALGTRFLDLDVDAVEVTNAVPGGGCRYNIATHELVRSRGCTLGFTGGSDAHHASQVGKGLTFFAGDEGVASLRRSLAAGLTRGAEAYWTTTEKALYYARLAWRLVVPPVPRRPVPRVLPATAPGVA